MGGTVNCSAGISTPPLATNFGKSTRRTMMFDDGKQPVWKPAKTQYSLSLMLDIVGNPTIYVQASQFRCGMYEIFGLQYEFRDSPGI